MILVVTMVLVRWQQVAASFQFAVQPYGAELHAIRFG